jgi:uncharacterized protein (TIGR04551 family)
VRRIAAAAFACVSTAQPLAYATGFTDIGQDFVARESAEVRLEGYLRLRSAALYNLDLDRGTTPSGKPLFPVPLTDPKAQALTRHDMRLRTDLAVYAPGGGLAVKTRVDVLDNLTLGSTPEGYPAGSATQQPPANALRVKRAWGEALTPLGLLAAGRMGNHWGMGMLANGGDCADCDSGDAADRIAFLTPIAGHIWAVAYDFTAVGPTTQRASSTRPVDIEPSTDVRTVTFAVLRHHGRDAIDRRRKADKSTVDYGTYASHRWQDYDIPATYVPTAQPVPLTPSQVMARGYRATAVDAWARWVHPWLRVELEGALIVASVDQASLVPGVLFREPVRSRQLGAALESEVAAPDGPVGAGVDAGYASGDPAPGFGAFPDTNAAATKPGELEGPQANPPKDNRVDNFRFHPDYRVDRILFREIVGTVTDTVYVRPHVRWRIARVGPGTLTTSLAGIGSWAVQPKSAPGGRNALGIELDPTLAYQHRDGFSCVLEHALLFPQSGLDNPQQNLRARPAQLVRVRLAYAF